MEIYTDLVIMLKNLKMYSNLCMKQPQNMKEMNNNELNT